MNTIVTTSAASRNVIVTYINKRHSIRSGVLERLVVLSLTFFLVTGCEQSSSPVSQPDLASAQQLDFPYTDTFTVYQRDGYHIVDMSAAIVTWGGEAEGERQSARIVIVPKDITPPALEGDLANATLVRTPLQRIAVNYTSIEAMLTALEINDRLVAVGGGKSYNDSIRQGVEEGRIAQIGYGWHMPPMLDPLLVAKPDALLMVMGDMQHAESYRRISDLGIPVVPIFLGAEIDYLAAVDYVKLVGLLTGKQEKAAQFADMVVNNVNRLKEVVSDQPKKTVLNAWYSGSGKWMAVVRNKDNKFIEDANGINPLKTEDDMAKSHLAPVSTEFLVTYPEPIDCWVIRDTHSTPFDDLQLINQIKAVQDGCLFAGDGMQKPEADAFDIYETAVVRPDLILQDYVKVLYPELIDEPYKYIRPDKSHQLNE